MASHSRYLVVLVNYNNWQDTIECIRSLQRGGVRDSSILVVENCSTNDSSKELFREFSGIEIIRNEENLGFSGGNNLGIRRGVKESVDYVILLNNDTLVESDTITTLIREMDVHKDASLGTGQIRYYPETGKIWYGGGRLVAWRGLAVHCDKDKSVDRLPKDQGPQYVSFISGCYMCIRVADFERLGLLDEKYFLYLEDIEYSARAVRNNLRLLYVPKSIVYHKWRGERQLKVQSLYYAVRNRKLLIESSFHEVARFYFSTVITVKMMLWYFMDKMLFAAARKGLDDFRARRFGKNQ